MSNFESASNQEELQSELGQLEGELENLNPSEREVQADRVAFIISRILEIKKELGIESSQEASRSNQAVDKYSQLDRWSN